MSTAEAIIMATTQEVANERLVSALRAGQEAILAELKRQGAEEYTGDHFDCNEMLPPHAHAHGPIVGLCELLVRSEDQEPLAVVAQDAKGALRLYYKPHLAKGVLHV